MVEAVVQHEPLGVEGDLEVAVFELGDEHRCELAVSISHVDVLQPDGAHRNGIWGGADDLRVRGGPGRVAGVDEPQLAILRLVHTGEEAQLGIVRQWLVFDERVADVRPVPPGDDLRDVLRLDAAENDGL